MNQWISQIVVYTVFAAVYEALLPQSKMKKYVRLVLGTFFIMVILEPLLGADWEIQLPRVQQVRETSMVVVNRIKEEYDTYILQALQDNVAGMDVEIKEVDCTLSEGGELKSMKVVCGRQETAEEPWVIMRIPKEETGMAGKLQQQFTELFQTEVIVEWQK